MVWLYVVFGLLVIIAILVLMNLEKRRDKVSKSNDHIHISIEDSLNICPACGNRFRGRRCTHCGFE